MPPTVVLGPGAGVGATASVSTKSSDYDGIVSVVPGQNPQPGGVIAVLSFAEGYDSAEDGPVFVAVSANDDGAVGVGVFAEMAATDDKFTIVLGTKSIPLLSGVISSWLYVVSVG